ncbi:MAG: hypothetical protein ACPL7B_09065 [Candidatus Poribacteria bacterium]
MPILIRKGIKDDQWRNTAIKMPNFDVASVIDKTKSSPKWIHIASSNIFRAMIAPL